MIELLNPTIQVELGGGTLFEWNCTQWLSALSYPDLTVLYHPHLYYNKFCTFTHTFAHLWKRIFQFNRLKMEYSCYNEYIKERTQMP